MVSELPGLHLWILLLVSSQVSNAGYLGIYVALLFIFKSYSTKGLWLIRGFQKTPCQAM